MKRELETVLYGWGCVCSILMIPVYIFYKEVWLIFFPFPCVLNAFFGIYCPGCGGTRAVEALLRGQILRALWYHPLVPYTAVIFGGFMITQTLERIGVKKVKGWKFHDWFLYVAVILLLGNCILKNVLRMVFHIAM